MRLPGDVNPPWHSREPITRHSTPYFKADLPHQVREDLRCEDLDRHQHINATFPLQHQFIARLLEEGEPDDEIIKATMTKFRCSKQRAQLLLQETYAMLALYLRSKGSS